MAVLVTGGAGYIGSHMVWALVDAGEEVVVLDRLSTGFRWAIAPEARFYEGDIADTALLSTIIAENTIDAIIHFAGSIIVPESVSDPLKYYGNNTVKSRALIESAAMPSWRSPAAASYRRSWRRAAAPCHGSTSPPSRAAPWKWRLPTARRCRTSPASSSSTAG